MNTPSSSSFFLMSGSEVSYSRRSPRRLGVAAVAAVAVVAGVLSAVPAAAQEQADRSAGGTARPVVVDAQTGHVSKRLELFRIMGDGAAEVDLSWTYRQPGRYAQPVTGLGVGMSWGNPEIIGNELVLASGQAVRIDPTTRTGVADHMQLDLELEVLETPAEPDTENCASMRPCAALLRSLDGTVHEFDVDGKLSAVRDVKRNTAWWEYDADGRVVSIMGGDADAPQTVKVDYIGDGRIVMGLPETTDGVSPVIEVQLENRLVTSISQPKADIDDGGDLALLLSWTEVGGVMVPSAWTEATGARTEISYQRVNNVVAVKEMVTKDPRTGAVMDKPLRVRLDPAGNEGRNYTGYPKYHGNTPLPSTQTSDPLVASNDAEFTYSLAIDDGMKVTTRTFDHLHRLVSEKVSVDGASINTLTHSYPDPAGTWPEVSAQYQLPTTIERTVHDPAGHRQDRTVTAYYEYDTRGRTTVEDLEDRSTATVYDTDHFDDGGQGYGLPLTTVRTAKTGRDAGTTRTETAELTADRSAIEHLTTTAQAPGGDAIVSEELFREYAETGAITAERTIGHGGGESVDRDVSTARTIIDGLLVIVKTAADGAVTTTRLDPATGLAVDETTPDDVTTTFRYDVQHRVVRVEKTGQPTRMLSYETFEKDGVNRRTTVHESDGYTIRDTADAKGRPLLAEDNFVGGRISADSWRMRAAKTYDERGNVSSETDAAGLTTWFMHDYDDRVVEVASPDGTRRINAYDDAAGVTVTRLHSTGENTHAEVTTTVTRDDEGRVIRQETAYADGAPTIIKAWTYTAFGEHMSTEEETAERTTENFFDAAGVLTGTRIQTDGSAIVDAAYRFDGAGNRLGKHISGAGAGADAHTETHDAEGRVLTSTDQFGNTTVHTYNMGGDRIRTDYPDQRSAHAEYAAGGRLVADWWTREGDSTRQRERRYTYDSNGNIATIEAVADPDGTRIRHTYTPDEKLLTSTYPDGSVIAYGYDDGDQLIALTDPDGTTTRYERDDAGRIVTVANGTATMTYAYDGLSRIAAITRTDATGLLHSRTTFETTSGGLTSRQTETDATGNTVLDEQHTYTGTGKLERTRTSVGENTPDLASGPLKGARAYTTVHTYDGIDRLTGTNVYAGHIATPAEDKEAELLTGSRYTHTSGAVLEQVTTTSPDGDTRSDRTLDAAGRTIQVVETATDGTKRTIDLAWDAQNNLIRDAKGIEYRYDIANNLTGWTAPDGTGSEIDYRIDGTRGQRTDTDGTHTTTYAIPGSVTNIILERITSPDGSTTSHATLGGSSPAAITSDGHVTWLLAGHRGDIVMTIGSNGVDSRAVYADYGTRTTSGSSQTYQPYGYAGALQDPTGRLVLGIRTLDTDLGHFTSKDPTNLLNRYAYAAGDPIQNIDPTGRMSDTWKDVLAGLGNFGGAAIGLAIAASSVYIAITGGAATPLVAAAWIGLGAEIAATAIATVLYVDHLQDNTWLNDETRTGLWAGAIGLTITSGALAGTAAYRALEVVGHVRFAKTKKGAELVLARNNAQTAVNDLKRGHPDPNFTTLFPAVLNKSRSAADDLDLALGKYTKSFHRRGMSSIVGSRVVQLFSGGYVSNPWGAPVDHRAGQTPGSAPPAGANLEYIPTPAQYVSGEREGSEAPNRGIYEVISQ